MRSVKELPPPKKMAATKVKKPDSKQKMISKAFKLIFKEISKDKGLYISYQANIAMAYYDEAIRQKSRDSHKKIHEIANQAATNFLMLLK